MTSLQRVEPSLAHVRQREPPLYQMPHMWQPNLNGASPYNSSHCDRIQLGWTKWSNDHPDWYARRAAAQEPDWYSRRIETIRSGDTRERMWPWESTSKPTQRKLYGLDNEPTRPWPKGYRSIPHDVVGEIPMPQWGLCHPHHYEEPCRVENLQPLVHMDDKNL